MVVQQRTEMDGSASRLPGRSWALATAAIIASVMLYPQTSDKLRIAILLLGGVGVLAFALLHLYAFPKRSHALLVHRGAR